MRKLITMIARKSRSPGLHEHGQLIDQLTALEVEGVAKDAPSRTLEAIRSTRLKLRVGSLILKTPLRRGH
ncbi:hypothetical protein [Methylobacterium sp. WL64]|uniref:hypothetical protein n=1 Tax=Methylobacterium sp. WL64 TaxID=2603894 RepID=UPI001FEFA090|nr:hypothetical protein [Methylobacterium sp. WL64]